MAAKFMSFIRCSRNKFHLDWWKIVCLVFVVVGLMLFVLFLSTFSDESVSRSYLDTYDYPDNVNADLNEMYETILSLCYHHLKQHYLVDVTGLYHLENDEVVFERITFSFLLYLNDRGDGGRESVIDATVNLNGENTVTVSEWIGPGKASPVSSISLLTDPQALSLAQKILLQMAMNEPDKSKFRIWRTVMDLSETGGLGAPSVEVYIRQSNN